MENKKFFKIIGIILTSIFILFFILSIIFQDYFQAIITEDIQRYGYLAIAISVFLLEFIPQYVSPHLIIINAVILGISTKTIIFGSIIGTLVASLLGFYLGKRYGIKIVISLYEKGKFSELEKKVNLHGKWIVLIAAFFPLPYLPIIFGSLELSWKNFFIYGLGPRIIGFIGLTFLITLF